jgi:hypothetical protein
VQAGLPAPAQALSHPCSCLRQRFHPRHADFAALLHDAEVQLTGLRRQLGLQYNSSKYASGSEPPFHVISLSAPPADDINFPAGLGHGLGVRGAFRQRDRQAGRGFAIATMANAE